MTKQTKRVEVQKALNGEAAPVKEDEDEKPGWARPVTAEELKIAETDEDYRKALNDEGGLTLVPMKKAKDNHTVEQISDKVYPHNMVIAKHL
ncbi:hypothetical protein [Rhizobium sp. Nf11,1]|uniref:hypothetical protein n=1 Tax=Rhizobium sp. Nf11,1 TaxID=3404923 RepID=UPI003D349410